jgi:hypothetical protein
MSMAMQPASLLKDPTAHGVHPLLPAAVRQMSVRTTGTVDLRSRWPCLTQNTQRNGILVFYETTAATAAHVSRISRRCAKHPRLLARSKLNLTQIQLAQVKWQSKPNSSANVARAVHSKTT